MKKALLTLLASLALPTAVNAQFDLSVHAICKDVSDYAGCVKANKDFDPQEIKKLNVFGFRYQYIDGGSGDYAEFNGNIFVQGIMNGSAADKAGLKFGDQIIKVNDASLSKEDPEQSILKIREATKHKNVKLTIARYSLKKDKKGRNVEVLDIQMNKKELKITVGDFYRFNDRNVIEQKWNAFLLNNLYRNFYNLSNDFNRDFSNKNNSKKFKNKKNNLLNQVNQRNFNQMLKRNETTGIRTYQPNYQPYGNVYGTSGQYGAGGY